MSYKPDESTWLSYIYDELSAKERKEVEQYLIENEDARKEVEELKEAQAVLGKIRDREVTAPTFSFDTAKVISMSNTEKWWRKPLAVAASISLIILTGYFVQLKISYGEEGFSMAFGVQQSSQGYSESEVESLIQKAIATNNETFLEQLKSSEEEVKKLVDSEAKKSKREIDSYLIAQRNQSIEVLRGLTEQSELAQQKYTDDVLQDFAIFLELQRQDDMEVIQARFENLADDTQLNRMQTNQLISNLYSDENRPANQY
ncbi:MAG: hypothetical protein RLN88_04085 [Ekhidna sp.]|uniref:anti-sigma factor family protein n=1 Tax=Ekhidna sp. TaxID=2608089 RepID=UPI0032EAB0E8